MAKEFATPGPRAIYPEMCDSRSLAKCGIVANALWPRLVAQADDQGRLAGDAVDILGLCFPKMLDKVSVRAVRTALDELEKAGMVTRYEVAGEPYIQIKTWWEWQSSMRRAYPSRNPAPEGWNDAVFGYDEHPRTYREVRGLEPRKRALDDDAEDSDSGSGGDSASETARTLRAREPQRAGTVPAPEPHGAANPRAQPRARVRAQPRLRGARPDPTVPESPTPTPPSRAGRSRRPTGNGGPATFSDYDTAMQRDTDDAEEDHLPWANR